jgi:four helix bundle protein
MFSLDKLKVYERALASTASLMQLCADWDKRHSVVDQLLRASESVVLNIGEGARLRGMANRQHTLDYAIGSALECAACLDIALGKQFLLPALARSQKEALCEVVKMLVGLRKAWAGQELYEETGSYGGQEKWLFAHERLKAYQLGLEFMVWFHALPGGPDLSTRLFRQIDKTGTSAVLNLAESNGRYLTADRRKFLDTAEGSVLKTATYLELGERTSELDQAQRDSGMALLDGMALRLRGLAELG